MTEDPDRAALRARQGTGARYDAETAPHDDLLLARRGTAYFARRLNDLRDEELSAPSRVPGWSRRHLIARICLDARAMALSLKALREPLVPDEVDWTPDHALTATLPARALRHLFDHSAKHLDVEWRDLPAPCWDRAAPSSSVGPAPWETPGLRARALWQGALDLGNGARERDVPIGMLGPRSSI